VEVRRADWLTPHLVRVTFGGPALDGFELGLPTGHIKVFLPSAGEPEPALPSYGPDGPTFDDALPRPTIRTYTPRRFDTATRELVVDFVIHEEGPASDWAARAAPGDKVAIAGPGRGYDVDRDARSFVIGGDEAALPALGVLLETLPSDASIDVIAEVRDDTARVELPDHPGARTHWCESRPDDAPGSALGAAFRDVELQSDTRVWVATEAHAVRTIRRALLNDRECDPARVVTRGYWKLGAANHPDGDYATDA
jgi:NADPH-dependent ferric siderophore reductase